MAWYRDDAPRLAAAVAFYTLFSFAPLIFVTILIAGAVFGEEAAAGQLAERLQAIVGLGASEVIQAAVANAHLENSSVLATLVTVLVSSFAATGVFQELRKALDLVWDRQQEPRGLKHDVLELARAKLWGLACVLAIGLFLLLSLFASALLASLGRQVDAVWTELFWLGRIVDMLISLGLGTLAFVLTYKFLPASRVGWRDLWLGAFVAAILFSVGRLLVGTYLAHSGLASVYGAAGALVVVMVWTWCSAMILLFGAELCQAYAQQQSRPIGAP